MLRSLFVSFLLLTLSACVTHSHATQFNGVPGIRGEAVEYQTTKSYAMHFLFSFRLWGNASKEYTIERFTKEASSRGASRVRIAQTEGTTYWYIFPPLSFLIHPVVQTIEGDVEGTGASE